MTNTYICLECKKVCILRPYQQDNKYCSNRCQAIFQSAEKLRLWKETGTISRINGTPNWLKNYILRKQDNKCAECGIKDWNNKPIIFDLEHKDGSSTNNKEDNLCCLCPNCHSQTSTYKAKNKGNGRESRRKINK